MDLCLNENRDTCLPHHKHPIVHDVNWVEEPEVTEEAETGEALISLRAETEERPEVAK